MDKTLTPSPWTTLMDYPNGLPYNGLPLKILFSDEYYIKKLRFYTYTARTCRDSLSSVTRAVQSLLVHVLKFMSPSDRLKSLAWSRQT